MKRYIKCAFLLVFGAWTDAGFNFRGTAGYVTDGANETYVLGQDDTYPVTRGGFTFGYTDTCADMKRDRDTGVDRRLAGVNQCDNSSESAIFRVDLDDAIGAGSYTVTIANGDTNSGQSEQSFLIKDNTVTEQTCDDTTGTSADNYNDATCNNRSEATIFSSQAALTATFGDANCPDEGNGAGPCLYLFFGANGAVDTGSSTMAHLQIHANAAADNLPLLQAIGED